MPKRKVLIVENEFLLYEELCSFFEDKGFTIVKNAEEVAVDNYEEAVQLIKDHRPDIAVLDIGLEGEKDGIDLGIYIRQQYNLPVIYLSGQANEEYIERLRESGDDKFVCKGKPLNKEQLWYTFRLALPKYTAANTTSVGDFLKVREVKIIIDEHPVKIVANEIGDPLENEMLIKWDMVVIIRSYNTKAAGDHNNNVLLRTDFSNKAYILRSSLDKLEDQLPYYFARFTKDTIVNLKEVKERSRTNKKLFYKIGDRNFEVADTYKNKVQEKINRLLKDPGFNIPEK